MCAINRLNEDHESGLTEKMTVQEIKRRYPSTRAVFESLVIGRGFRFDGDACLDEVAWSHGMGSQTLLGLLEAAFFRSCASSA